MAKDFFEHYEEDLERHEKRLSRSDRKILRAKDRSQYKKSDQDQQKKLTESFISAEGTDRGRVLNISGEFMEVATATGTLVPCVVSGALKHKTARMKNIIAVGDFVHFIPMNEREGMVLEVEPRTTVLSRADNLSHQKEHIIAANIDLVLITVSVGQPLLKTPIIDRYIIAADKGKMKYVIIINKIDLLESEEYETEKAMYEETCKAYALAAVPLIGVSTVTGEGMDKLKEVMHNKASVFSGQSGVGKSSLINMLTGSELPTRTGVERTGKGAHTTTKAQLIPIESGGWVIDTPGIRSFGMWDLNKDEVAAYFDEFALYFPKCRFANCTHTHEEGCAVIQAVEEEKIHPLRYYSYCALLEQLDQEHLRR
ncbi:MAG: ribosome small subunit-dependent GTPase A [Parachlamydiales bacterium]|jgi:ribosome biogenesis GTPase